MISSSKLSRAAAAVASVTLLASLAACGKDNNKNSGTEDMSSTNNQSDMGSNNGSNNGTDMGTTGADMGSTTGNDMGMTTGNDMGMTTGNDMGMTTGNDMGMADMGTPFDGYLIFGEDLNTDLTLAPFIGSTNAIQTSQDEAFSGASSLKVSVPAGGYTGGAYVPTAPVDLSSYNALTFQVKASQAATLNVAGFGNTGQDNVQQIEQINIALTTSWQEVIIPIPNPSLATSVAGLFHFAEGSDEGAYDIYFDDIAFVSLDVADFANPAPAFGTASTTLVVGQTTTPTGAVYNVEVQGAARSFPMTPFWFDWTSSDASVASVSPEGLVTALAAGSTTVTATLDGTPAGGQLDITVIGGPTAAAPAPVPAAADVEASVYSNAYTNVTVDTYLAFFSAATLTPIQVAGDDVLVYGGLDFAGILMEGPNSIDISAASTLHVDIWTPNAVLFGIKLVDFGADNAFGGGDDSEYQVDLTSTDFTTGQWERIEIPLSTFDSNGLNSRTNISQIILVGRTSDGAGGLLAGQATVFVDNFFFY